MLENTCSFSRSQLQSGLLATVSFFGSRGVRTVDGCFCGEESQQLFDLHENAFHLIPAEGAQRLTLDVTE